MPSAYSPIVALALLASSATALTAGEAPEDRRFATYANPVDLPYRYQPSRRGAWREAADPTVISFKDRYWLFPSHSHGYWWSTDLLHWHFVLGKGYEVGKFAPTVVEIRGRLYLSTSEGTRKIWTTDDPSTGLWTEAADLKAGANDPDLFLDDDGRLYLYEGVSFRDPLRVHELDPKTFQRLRSADIPQVRDVKQRGWEVVGDNNEQYARMTFIEGSWVTKHNGRYYMQFSAPGTEFKTYADGLLVADDPMGPFTYQSYSPISIKPSGFVTGAGHGSIFKGPGNQWWSMSTMTISVRHAFERRLGLHPASFSRSGQLSMDTYLGDYPRYIDKDRTLTGWMLLSRRKPVRASSTLAGFDPEKAVDEEVRSWWSARTGDASEWYQIDLGGMKTIQAVQINFADQDAAALGISNDSYKYVLELSNDGRVWRTALDKSVEGRDAPHDYQVLAKPTRARFVRLRNVHSPDGAKFSLYDLRVFGNGDGGRPGRVSGLMARRDVADPRKMHMEWKPVAGAEFYIVRLGVRGGPFNQNHQVYDGASSLDVASLNVGSNYCFSVDAVNENGVNRGRTIRCVE